MADADYQQREADAVAAIKAAIPKHLKKNLAKDQVSDFAELFEAPDIFPHHLLACSIDGVGTKLVLAEAMEKYDTIGIDCVAMSANDLVTLGAVSPFLFMDYLAVQEHAEAHAGEIIRGVVNGLEQCDTSGIIHQHLPMNIGKGETASADELLSSFRPGFGFDIAGAMIGFIKKDRLPKKATPGDVIIALQSSGPHSNGYTDLRHKLLRGEFESRKEYSKSYSGRFRLDDPFHDSTIGGALLEPTRIYVKEVAAIAKKFSIAGVNSTGYGLKNLNRLGNLRFDITAPLEPQPIFSLMQEEANYTVEKMYRTFNMGMGFFVIADRRDADDILGMAKGAVIVGGVAKGSGTVLHKGGKKILYEGY